MELYQLILVSVLSVTVLGGLIIWTGWLFYMHYILIPGYIRAVVYRRDGSRALIWLKKKEEKNGLGTAFNMRFGTFTYNLRDVYRLGKFAAVDISENSFKALVLDQAKMQLDAERSLHPQILKDLFINKFIIEIVETKLDIVKVLVIIILAVTSLSAAFIIYKLQGIGVRIASIESGMNITQAMLSTVR